MSKTNSLDKLIKTKLDTLSGETYRDQAPDSAAFPYKVFSSRTINLGDLSRDDIPLIIDVYDKSTNSYTVNELADDIEELFNNVNLPQTDILPTFFRTNRTPVTEDDKTIRHIELEFLIQNYEI